MQLRLLTLNLHCWQEPRAREKLRQVADLIVELSPDVVCLQEVGQLRWLPSRNAARIVVAELSRRGHEYEYSWDWAHYGFGKWREGVALLVRGRIDSVRSEYVSRSRSHSFWKSRIAQFAQVTTAGGIGLSVVNTHLGWSNDSEEPFAEQWARLVERARELPGPVFIAGDLNQPAGGPGHALILETPGVVDCDLGGAPTFPGGIDGWEGKRGGRIDYVLRLGDGPEPVAASTYCNGADRPQISDHYALLVTFS